MNSKITILLVATFLFLGTAASEDTIDKNVIQATKNLLGVNCLIEAIFDIENSANDFTFNIEVCGGKASTIASNALADTTDLLEITEKIIKIDDNVCKNAAFNPKTDAKKKSPAACATRIQRQMTRLNDIVELTKTDLADTSNKNSCVEIATNTYQLGLNNFNAYIQNCATVAAKV